jgi:hypothetical protein
MKRVKLECGSEITIADEAFEDISAMVKANRVCEGCDQAYAPNRPNVALNLCLQCFLRKHANQGFTYIKRYEVNQQGSEIHWFLDPFNLIHYTNSTSKDAQKSEHFTLLYWGFPIPQTWQDGDETKQVNHWHWSFYGDPKADRVLVIHNTIDYGSDRSFDFLSYRDGRTVQIDRKRGEGRRLFLAARSGLRQRMTDTATMWTARLSIRWRPIGFAESLPRSPTKKTSKVSKQALCSEVAKPKDRALASIRAAVPHGGSVPPGYSPTKRRANTWKRKVAKSPIHQKRRTDE